MMRIPSKPSLNYTFCLLIFVFLSFVGATRMHGPKGGPELASITSPNRVNGSQIGRNLIVPNGWKKVTSKKHLGRFLVGLPGTNKRYIVLKSAHNKWLSAKGNTIVNDKTHISQKEKFEIIFTNDGFVGLKTWKGKYLSAQTDGRLEANRDHLRQWEKFIMYVHGDSIVTLKSSHGKWLSAQPNGRMEVNRNALDHWEMFYGFPKVTVYLKICKDKDAKHQNCAGWKKAKFCQPGHNHFGFMKDNCPMTCGFCECKDKVNTCLHFRSKHYCIVGDRFYAYMKGNCKKTCGFCGNVRRSTRPPIIVPPGVVFPPANKLNSKLCGIKGPGRVRIVGGVETAVAEFPWIVGIVRKTNKQVVICGGTLLTNRWILTAAHCFSSRSSRRPENFLIRLGEHDLLKKEGHERIAEIDTIKVHENWDTSTYNNDIALLRLKNSVEFNRFHKPICMPFQGEKFRIGKTCIVAGWGRLGQSLATAKQLQKVELPLTQHKLCKDTFAAQEEIVTDQMICSGLKAGGKDSCQGDSGGPLICQRDDGQHNFIQVGIVSWGKGCAKKGFYGVYARVSSFRTWIENNIKD